MRVLLCATHAQLEVRDALETQGHGRPPCGVLISRLPDAAVGAQPFGIRRDEFGEMLRADLLFAFVEDADAQRELAYSRAVGLDRLESRHEVAFVVGHATSEDVAVSFGGLERRRRPF